MSHFPALDRFKTQYVIIRLQIFGFFFWLYKLSSLRTQKIFFTHIRRVSLQFGKPWNSYKDDSNLTKLFCLLLLQMGIKDRPAQHRELRKGALCYTQQAGHDMLQRSANVYWEATCATLDKHLPLYIKIHPAFTLQEDSSHREHCTEGNWGRGTTSIGNFHTDKMEPEKCEFLFCVLHSLALFDLQEQLATESWNIQEQKRGWHPHRQENEIRMEKWVCG